MDRIVEEWDKKAGDMLDEAEAELKGLWGKARSKVTGEATPDDPGKTTTLEARPEEVKVLYARVLALQALVDGRLDPREIEYLYVVMFRVGLSSDSREEVRRSMRTEEISYGDVVELVDEVVSSVPDNQDEIAVSHDTVDQGKLQDRARRVPQALRVGVEGPLRHVRGQGRGRLEPQGSQVDEPRPRPHNRVG